ncbi:hypothetical protein F2P81_024525 [Scophthalmus maximus]|uniref:C2H2-type domain-containing protein n=1 Tax=Scophthalmus maximus TaxID=52904 RepID=A0A6A4RUI3_SCOMX|nr:hypothetical protein F2P81_024525 [Scophthalmus maximus]
MSSVQHLREFIGERLTAAALEIFGVFEKTVVAHEEEIARLRKLLEPGATTRQWTELPQHLVCKEEEVLTDQERNSSLDQEEPEPLQIKEEQEEICLSQEGEQLVLKQETDAFMLTPVCEEGDHREPEPDVDHKLLSHNSPVAESQDQEGSKHVASGSRFRLNTWTMNSSAEPKPQKSPHKKKSQSNTSHAHTKCVTCGKCFKFKYELYAHLKSHAEQKLYWCKICGKRILTMFSYKAHMRFHTGEKPYSCQECGESFDCCGTLTTHMTSHALERQQETTLSKKILHSKVTLPYIKLPRRL